MTDIGVTPLYTSLSFEGHVAVLVKLLLAHGADANIRDDDGSSPLYYACRAERATSSASRPSSRTTPTSLGRTIAAASSGSSRRREVTLGCLKLIREWPVTRNQITVKLCVSKLKEQGMYDVVNAVPLNELSKEMFVYKVLDEMMSRQMYGLAEQVVNCVGTGKALE
jgi:hypothetical protein